MSSNDPNVNRDDARQQSKAVWNEMADGWERRRDYLWEVSRAVGEWMVAKLEPRPGQTVLELAAGMGDTGFLAAEHVGAGGRVLCTDFAPAMVDAARRRAQELGVSNVEFMVIDAENLELEDDSVDGVLCRWGYMLMTDPGAAFAETRRVLRPGGRLALSVMGPPPNNPWASLPVMTLVQGGHMPAPDPQAPGLFALADLQRLTELLAGAGFSAPEIEVLTLRWRFDNFDDYWEFLNELAGVLSTFLGQIAPEQAPAVRNAIEQSVSDFRAGEGYEFPFETVNAITS